MDITKGISPAACVKAASGQLDNFIAATTPGGIEAQEAQGQTDFVCGDILPRIWDHEDIINAESEKAVAIRAGLQAAGFRLGDVVDEVFIAGKLPSGWTKRKTDSSYYTEIVDAAARVRAFVFYKAAFYDRSAHASIVRAIEIEHDQYRDGFTKGDKVKVWIRNRATEKILHEVCFVSAIGEGAWEQDEKNQRRAWAQLQAILDMDYSDHRQPFAYWSA